MKKIFLLLIALSPLFLWSQTTVPRRVVGWMGGLDSQLLGIQTLDGLEPERTAVLSEHPKVGGSIGAFARWPLLRGVAIQSELIGTYTTNRVRFRPEGIEQYRFLDVDLPLHLVFTNRSAQALPLRAVFLVGARLGWNFLPDRSGRLSLYQERLGLDLGMGVQVSARKWHLQPELVYSHGLNNLHQVTNAPYDYLVGRIMRDRLTLRLLVWKKSDW